MDIREPCYRIKECGVERADMFVRRMVAGQPQSVGICDEHWQEEEGTKVPVCVK